MLCFVAKASIVDSPLCYTQKTLASAKRRRGDGHDDLPDAAPASAKRAKVCDFSVVCRAHCHSVCDSTQSVDARLCDLHQYAAPHAEHPVARSPFAPLAVNGAVLAAIHRSAQAKEREILAVEAIHGQEEAAETATAAFRAGFQAGIAESSGHFDFYS